MTANPVSVQCVKDGILATDGFTDDHAERHLRMIVSSMLHTAAIPPDTPEFKNLIQQIVSKANERGFGDLYDEIHRQGLLEDAA